MSGRRRDHIGGGKALSTVLYVLIIAVLLACMGYLYYYSRQQQQSNQDRIAQLKREESGALESFEEGVNSTEETAETATEETSEESITDDTTAADTSAEETSTEEPSAEEPSTAEVSSVEGSESVSEPFSEKNSDAVESVPDEEMSSDSPLTKPSVEPQTEAESTVPVHTVRAADANAAKKEISVIVLNGTRKDGVAGYWKECFQEEGFKDVVAATYKAAIDSETVLYVAEKKQAEYFKKFFPNAEVKIGSLEAYAKYIVVAAEEDALDTYDVWVVVGMNDAKTE